MRVSTNNGELLSWLNLLRLPFPVKALCTGYLMAAGLGLLIAVFLFYFL